MEKRRLTVLYGSQTGTAQDVAERIWRDAKRFFFSGPVQSMDDYNIAQLIYEERVIFVCSTTGQGEEPDNMKSFWRFLLRKNLPLDSLKNLKFGVLGLGDSSYSKFNHVAKKLYRRMLGLGGTALVPLGLADDQHDLGADAVVEPWIVKLWERLVVDFPLPSNMSLVGLDLKIAPRWNVSILEQGALPCNESNNSDTPSVQKKQKLFMVTVKSNVRTTCKTHFQDVRLIKLDDVPVDAIYEPGDVLMVVPKNLPSNIDKLLELLTGEDARKAGGLLTPDTVLHVTQADLDMAVPDVLLKPRSVKDLATSYWDLSAVPRRYMLQVLSQITPDELEREKLEELSSSEGQEEMFNYLNRPRRTVVELLADFPHATSHIPYTMLFELLPPIRARAFSIASSPKAHRGQLHVLVAVVQYKTKLLTPRLGLCSNWMAALQPSVKIQVWLRRGSLRFPVDKCVPVIMVGPGTGVAPFRSFIQERVAEGTADAEILHLFFGCRYKTRDFHCADEWEALQSDGYLSLHCAFSRDQEEKVYVQHILTQKAQLIWRLLAKGAYIYVAGNSNNMPSAVREAIKGIISGSGLTENNAEKLLLQMEQSGRYQAETWA